MRDYILGSQRRCCIMYNKIMLVSVLNNPSSSSFMLGSYIFHKIMRLHNAEKFIPNGSMKFYERTILYIRSYNDANQAIVLVDQENEKFGRHEKRRKTKKRTNSVSM